MTKRVFKTKIPQDLHPLIAEWKRCGMEKQTIMAKLEKEHNFHTTYRTLERLFAHLAEEEEKHIKAIIKNQVKNEIVNDFATLNRVCEGLVELAENAKHDDDNNLYLKTVDRLAKILAMKLSINTKDNQQIAQNQDELLDAICQKLKQ